MPNGSEVNEKLEFKERIGKMSDRELAEDTAERTYDLAVRLISLETCVDTSQTKLKQTGATSGGIAGTIAAAVAAFIYWLITEAH